jgi:FtsZ-binding cell division protein ZapB
MTELDIRRVEIARIYKSLSDERDQLDRERDQLDRRLKELSDEDDSLWQQQLAAQRIAAAMERIGKDGGE